MQPAVVPGESKFNTELSTQTSHVESTKLYKRYKLYNVQTYFAHLSRTFTNLSDHFTFNPLTANHIKWSNTHTQFVGICRRIV